MDKDVIQTIIRAHVAEVRSCYEAKLASRPTLSGRVVTQFTIDAKGTVTRSKIQSTTMNDTDVETCISRAVCGWTFPQPRGGGIVIVAYPFMFLPEGKDAGATP